MSSYTINTVTIMQNGAANVIRGGLLLSDAGTITLYQAAGGITAPSTDPTVTTAYNLAQYLLSTGQDERIVDAFMLAAYASTAYSTQTQHITVDLPLATLQTETSGTAFNIGAALPANAQIVDAEIDVVAVLAGTGPLTAAHITVQNTSETAGALIASTDIFTATGYIRNVGSNPYPTRGGQQLQATITAVGGTMAALTAGHVQVHLFYQIVP
jgi:hypothetical protein